MTTPPPSKPVRPGTDRPGTNGQTGSFVPVPSLGGTNGPTVWTAIPVGRTEGQTLDLLVTIPDLWNARLATLLSYLRGLGVTR